MYLYRENKHKLHTVFVKQNSSLKITGEFRSVNRSQATPFPCMVLSLLQTLMLGLIWPRCASGIDAHAYDAIPYLWQQNESTALAPMAGEKKKNV